MCAVLTQQEIGHCQDPWPQSKQELQALIHQPELTCGAINEHPTISRQFGNLRLIKWRKGNLDICIWGQWSVVIKCLDWPQCERSHDLVVCCCCSSRTTFSHQERWWPFRCLFLCCLLLLTTPIHMNSDAREGSFMLSYWPSTST